MRKRVITLLFLPIAVFLWIIGWTMLWTGSRKQQQTQQTPAKTISEDDFITITAMISEEPEECET
jgi:lipopolysaccharide biosynthesis regulator YciM